MLKEFIAHIQKTTQPIIHQVGDSTFAISGDGGAKELRPTIYHPDTLPLHSLEALVKMVQTEAVNMDTPLYITVPNHLTVRCFGQPMPDARYFRQVYYEAKATDAPGFQDGFREQEKAIIELRSRFAPGEGVDYLLDLLSRISKDSGVTTNDNGISQTVEARQGIALKATVQVRPRVSLRPFRTFQEVEQPESEFLLRLDEDGNIGLFEADGGMWKLTARQTVKAFLEKKLAELIASEAVYIAL